MKSQGRRRAGSGEGTGESDDSDAGGGLERPLPLPDPALELWREAFASLRKELTQASWQIKELHGVLLGSAQAPGLSNEMKLLEQKVGYELAQQDTKLAILHARLNELFWPRAMAVVYIILGFIFGAIGVEIFLIKGLELHKLGVW